MIPKYPKFCWWLFNYNIYINYNTCKYSYKRMFKSIKQYIKLVNSLFDKRIYIRGNHGVQDQYSDQNFYQQIEHWNLKIYILFIDYNNFLIQCDNINI